MATHPPAPNAEDMADLPGLKQVLRNALMLDGMAPEAALSGRHATALCNFLEAEAWRTGLFRKAAALGEQIAARAPDLNGVSLCALGMLHYGAHDLEASERYFTQAMLWPGRKRTALTGLRILQEMRGLLRHGKAEFPLPVPASAPAPGLVLRKKVSGTVFLTIDDGPNPLTTPPVLDLLKKYGQLATFFVTGQGAERYPDLIRRMADEGHLVCGHSFDHRVVYSQMTPEACVEDIRRTEAVLTGLRGKNAKMFYRFPGGQGHFAPEIHAQLKQDLPDLRIAHWHALCHDTQLYLRQRQAKNPKTELIATVARLLHDVQGAGEILLMHEILCDRRIELPHVDALAALFDLVLYTLHERNLISVPLAGKEV